MGVTTVFGNASARTPREPKNAATANHGAHGLLRSKNADEGRFDMARARSVEDAQRQLDAIKVREQQIKEQLKDLKRREAQGARKKRNHALMVYGALVEHYMAGGDWTRLDPGEFAAYMARFGGGRAAKRCLVEPRSAAEASAALRQWERNGREARKEDRRIVERALEESIGSPLDSLSGK